MCVTHPNPSTSAPYQPLRNARLFSPLGVSRGLLLLLLLACFALTPSTSQADTYQYVTIPKETSRIPDVTPAYRKLSEPQTDLRTQLAKKNSSGKQGQPASATSRQTSTTAKPSPEIVKRDLMREKCVQRATAFAEVREQGMEQVRSALNAYSAWLDILDSVELDVEKFDENVMILLEKYAAVTSALEWVGTWLSAELTMYEKIASSAGRSRSVPVYTATTYGGGMLPGINYGDNAPKKDSREAGILSKCSAKIAKLKKEQDTYNAIRTACERKFNRTLETLLLAYVQEKSGANKE